jgi:alkylation response protein AidB-like acyl-CoA dehydrogenase
MPRPARPGPNAGPRIFGRDSPPVAMVDLSFTPEDRQFRIEVREFVERNLSPEVRRKVTAGAPVSKVEHQAWQASLAAAGWLAPNWPKAYGGAAWDPIKRFIFDEETSLAGAPRGNIPAIDLLGPILLAFGTEAQKQRFLPRILSGEDWWCQGFSEPGAGSDLASLKCRAELIRQEYVVNGSKIWTSHAHLANWIFCLVRTSTEGRKQAGISFLLIPMDAPGITVRPIPTLGGLHVVNEVFFDNVRTEAGNLVGREGEGWRMTGILLGHERLVGAGLGPSQRHLQQLKIAARHPPFADDQAIQDRVTLIETELVALRYTAYRVLAAEVAGQPPGAEVSVLKLKGARIQQDLAEMMMEVAGPAANLEPRSAIACGSAFAEDASLFAATTYFDLRKLGIYGGSNEIQKNIIAHRILNLQTPGGAKG